MPVTCCLAPINKACTSGLLWRSCCLILFTNHYVDIFVRTTEISHSNTNHDPLPVEKTSATVVYVQACYHLCFSCHYEIWIFESYLYCMTPHISVSYACMWLTFCRRARGAHEDGSYIKKFPRGLEILQMWTFDEDYTCWQRYACSLRLFRVM